MDIEQVKEIFSAEFNNLKSILLQQNNPALFQNQQESIPKKSQQEILDEKLGIGKEACEVGNNCIVADRHGVDEKTIRNYKQMHLDLIPPGKKSNKKQTRTKLPKYAEMEVTLIQWIKEQRKKGVCFNYYSFFNVGNQNESKISIIIFLKIVTYNLSITIVWIGFEADERMKKKKQKKFCKKFEINQQFFRKSKEQLLKEIQNIWRKDITQQLIDDCVEKIQQNMKDIFDKQGEYL